MICPIGNATHNRAGQIVYEWVSGDTYIFTHTQFFNTLGPNGLPNEATRQRIRNGYNVWWDDRNFSTMPCVDVQILSDNYTKAVFQIEHTFSGPGVYTIRVEDPNRNEGIDNIPGSVGVVFSVQTILRIDPNFKPHNAPKFEFDPIDKAAVGRRFVHNPGAFDVDDGDVLTYDLVICTRERGVEIETYTLPAPPDVLYVDANTGELVWDAPDRVGVFNVCLRVSIWRDDVRIGSIVRDMQIEVVETDNNPPEFPPLEDICVVAGELINFEFEVIDHEDDFIVVTAAGDPFLVNSNPAGVHTTRVRGKTTVTFTWQTDLSHLRRLPYTVVFKAEDQNTEVRLVSFANFNITVIAPPVNIMPAVVENRGISLEWSPFESERVAGYDIYRRIGSFDEELKPCETGVPDEWGYERIADGISNTFYHDNNVGRSVNYCYRAVTIFSDGAKSLPSCEVCETLPEGTPPIIRAHVETIHDAAGKIIVEWLEEPVIKVIDEYIDNNPGKQPDDFEYRLFYTTNINAGNWTHLESYDLGYTMHPHEQINTRTQFPYYYKVELWDKESDIIIDDDYEVASTFYPTLTSSNRSITITFGRRITPWINEKYDIYRCASDESGICYPIIAPDSEDWVGDTYQERFTDDRLKNGQEYCYLIRSEGYRVIDGIRYENVNWSHLACAMPEDKIPPCPPEFSGETVCDENRNLLTWTYDPVCLNAEQKDVEKFLIYFSHNGIDFSVIGSVDGDTYSYSDDGSRVGYYWVAAVDTAGNISPRVNVIMSTPCTKYELPNVFTPNNDGIYDIFKSYYPNDGVPRRVNMEIFTRTNILVFKTEDPDINWDGFHMSTGRIVSSGIYYYICDLYEDWPSGQTITNFAGFIHVYSGNDAQPFAPPLE